MRLRYAAFPPWPCAGDQRGLAGFLGILRSLDGKNRAASPCWRTASAATSTAKWPAGWRSRKRCGCSKETPADTKPYDVLRRMFTAACTSVHNAALAQGGGKAMATTLDRVDLSRSHDLRRAQWETPGPYFIRQKRSAG